jgi:hypothetical protein
VTDGEEKRRRSGYAPAPERLTREQFLRVVHLAGEMDEEATRCAEIGAFRAACAMTACALEAMLLANVLAWEPDLERAGAWAPTKKPPEEWHLPELVEFHLAAGWISHEQNPRLAEVVVFVNDLRNVLLHPGRLIREAPLFQVDEAAFRGMYAILQGAFEETNRLYSDSVFPPSTPPGAV